MADLRTLAQAVVEAWEARHQGRERPTDVQDAYDILAALDAADAQGYARAMGEVESAMDAASDEALAEYQARRSDYRDGFCDGLCEAYRIAQNTAKAAREQAAAAERD